MYKYILKSQLCIYIHIIYSLSHTHTPILGDDNSTFSNFGAQYCFFCVQNCVSDY